MSRAVAMVIDVLKLSDVKRIVRYAFQTSFWGFFLNTFNPWSSPFLQRRMQW